FLQGATTYTGGTVAYSGFIVFDNGELPSAGNLRTVGSATTVGGSYIGITDFVDTNPALYLASFDQANSWGIVGFDTHQGNATASYANVDLTGFNNGVFLGTVTQAELTGTIATSTVTNGSNAANTLRLTAANGGTLTVSGTLADAGPSLSVMLGSPFNNEAYSSGTVILSAHNTYTGNTTLNGTGLTLGLANNAALGFGDLHLASGFSNAMGVTAVGGPITLANDVIFDSDVALHVLGPNHLTLTGELSGTGTIQLQRAVTDTAGALTLGHDNSSFAGAVNLQNFHLTLAHDRAAGSATLNFFDEGSFVTFSAAALNPVIEGIASSGNVGRLGVHDGAILTFASNNDDQDHEFGGVIADPSGNATTAAVVVTSNLGELLRLYGDNLYSGGTTITDVGVVLMGHDNALGTGTVTLNAPDGGLLLDRNVTLTNNLNYLAGGLGGFGTIDPGNLSVLTIGANQMLLPGVGGGLQHSTGTLHIAFNTAFANGGTYAWTLQDATTLEGASKILINGNLDLTALSSGGFTLTLRSLDLDGNADFANLVAGNNYNFTLLSATGSILGFDPSDFTIDAVDFQDGTMVAAQFLLSSDGQNLTLSFTAVPEPSTWALLLAGAGVLGWTQRRRRVA
ncbi:MAG TPA: PEP-CTERM sorting domain-containing protein, partial [Lacunisphaera sp.]|nr:PEP-CTERM sorting domain-containing protein [Lacunisphaera sp.]